MHTRITAAMKPGAQTVPLVVLLVGAGVGALLGLLPSPLGTALSAVLAAVAVSGALLALVVTYRTGPARRVDWVTADDYEHRLTQSLPVAVHAVLLGAQQEVLRRTRAAVGVHPYVMRPDPAHQLSCTIDAGGCSCARVRLSAALLPSRRHPVLVFGERLLTNPELLSFVLAHEAHHARRASRTMHGLLGVPLLAGWAALGLTVPPRLLIAAPALWLAATAARWGDELRADIAAVHAIGPDTARDYWTLVQAARPHPTGVSRVLGAAGRLLAPHPPIWVRAALAARIPGPSPSPTSRS